MISIGKSPHLLSVQAVWTVGVKWMKGGRSCPIGLRSRGRPSCQSARDKACRFGVFTFALLSASAALAFCGCAVAPGDGVVDPDMARRADLVIRGEPLLVGRGTQFLSHNVRVLQVLKNSTGIPVYNKTEILVQSIAPGIPDGVSTIYIELLIGPQGKRRPWWLLGGTAETGISHTKPTKIGRTIRT